MRRAEADSPAARLPGPRTVVVANDLGELRRASAWLAEAARALGVRPGIAADLELCLNEALANTIEYGYCGHPDPAPRRRIWLRLAMSEAGTELSIEDDAVAFDPLQVPPPPAYDSLEHARIGGHGVNLIRRLVPQPGYERAGDRNRLRLRFPAPGDRETGVHEGRARQADRRRADASAPVGMPERRHSADRRRHAPVLAAPLFSGIAWDQLEAIVAGCPVRRLAPGEVLLQPGQPNAQVYVLLSGRLRVQLSEAEDGEGIRIEPGGSIGELSAIDRKPASAAVIAEAESDVAEISGERFWDALVPVPGFARNVMRLLAARMRASNDLIVERLLERLQLEHLQKELRIARGIQESLLPARGALDAGHAALDLYGLMDSAEDIGGDLYDAFMPDAGRLVLAVGDVSGKGIPAALFMARVMAALRAEAMRLRRPDALVARMNAVLCAHNESGMFVSLLVAVLEVETGLLTYANAGHLPPAHAKAGGRFGWLGLPRGLVAGMMESARYVQERVQLDPDERVVLYTDGVTEAADLAGGLYGEERLLRALDAAGGSAGDAVEGLRADVAAFARGARASDDITLLALRWRGPATT